MPSTPLTQLIMKQANFSAAVGTGTAVTLTEFSDHADNVALTTTATAASFLPVSGKNIQTVGDPTETLTLNLAQSLKKDSLWMFLRNNHGKEGKVSLTPTGGAKGKVEATVIFQAPATLGGAQGGGVSAATLLVQGLAEITPED